MDVINESIGLERFYANCRAAGINENNFTSLTFQDYDALGITDHADRQKLFKLIQVVKRELENPSSFSSSRSSTNVKGRNGRKEASPPSSSPPQDDAGGKKGVCTSRIRVAVRKRPVSKKEKKKGDADCVKLSSKNNQTAYVHEKKYVGKLFYFHFFL